MNLGVQDVRQTKKIASNILCAGNYGVATV